MIDYRDATKKDVDALFDLMLGIAKYHDQEQFLKTSKEQMLQSGFGENPKFGAIVAAYEDTLVGYLSYTWNYSIWNGSDYMNLDDLFVLNEYRQQNIGKKLMEAAQQKCLEKKIHLIKWEVEKNNTKAIHFYNRLGAEMNIKGIFKWKF